MCYIVYILCNIVSTGSTANGSGGKLNMQMLCMPNNQRNVGLFFAYNH